MMDDYFVFPISKTRTATLAARQKAALLRNKVALDRETQTIAAENQKQSSELDRSRAKLKATARQGAVLGRDLEAVMGKAAQLDAQIEKNRSLDDDLDLFRALHLQLAQLDLLLDLRKS